MERGTFQSIILTVGAHLHRKRVFISLERKKTRLCSHFADKIPIRSSARFSQTTLSINMLGQCGSSQQKETEKEKEKVGLTKEIIADTHHLTSDES